MKSKSLIIVAALLLAAACSTNTTMTSSSSTMPGMAMYSDNDIAAIVSNANQGEIDEGNAAVNKASSDDVRAFARMMVTDHTNALNQARSLFDRNSITPNMSNDIAGTLQSGARQTVSALNTYSGSDFDRQYMQALNDSYNYFFFHYTEAPLLVVNTNAIDFVKNTEDLEDLVARILAHTEGTVYYTPLPSKDRRKIARRAADDAPLAVSPSESPAPLFEGASADVAPAAVEESPKPRTRKPRAPRSRVPE